MRKNFFISMGKKSFYILGVSGGPDSMFMLDKMRRLGYNFAVVHVNYKKRNNSDEDEKIIFNYCYKFRIIFFSFYPTQFNKNGNFQDLARKSRYDYFIEVSNKLSNNSVIGGIVVAHNFEDYLETYVLQIERNSYSNFLGLKFKSVYKNYFLFRPILNFRKEFIIKYLEKKKIIYSIDYSNNLNIYRRNVIRKYIFSLLECEKIKLNEVIINKNEILNLKIKEFEKKIKIFINEDTINLTNSWFENSLEIQIRLVYYWINNYSNGSFFQNKKKVLLEICKQFRSLKKEITIKIGKGFLIKKINNFAIIK